MEWTNEITETEYCPYNLNDLEVCSSKGLIISHSETQKLLRNKFLPLNPHVHMGAICFLLPFALTGVPPTSSFPIHVLPSPLAQLNFAPPHLFPDNPTQHELSIQQTIITHHLVVILKLVFNDHLNLELYFIFLCIAALFI